MQSFRTSQRRIPVVAHDRQGSRTLSMDFTQGRQWQRRGQVRRRAESEDYSLGEDSQQETAESIGTISRGSSQEALLGVGLSPLRRSARPRRPPERFGT
ncbi:hypothetical protein MTO96_016230 [Rhipicephalus appendiculatus]